MCFLPNMATTSLTPDRAWMVSLCPPRISLPGVLSLLVDQFPSLFVEKDVDRKDYGALHLDLCTVDSNFRSALTGWERQQVKRQLEADLRFRHPVLWQRVHHKPAPDSLANKRPSSKRCSPLAVGAG